MRDLNHATCRAVLCAAIAASAWLCTERLVVGDENESPEPVVPIATNDSTSETRIRAKLAEPTALEFVETPISDVIEFLKDRHEIPIVIDSRALDEVGIGSDQPVTIGIEGISLRSALQLMLRQLDLTWDVRDEVLLITTYESLDSSLVTQVYDVPDLVASPHGAVADPQPLMDLIMATVAPEAWDVVGGSGSIAELQGSLVISQSHDVHDQVTGLLSTLRKAKHALAENPKKAFGRRWNLSDDDTPSSRRIQAALEKPTPKLDFIETALSDVADFISDSTEIPILLDQRALDEIGIGSDTPISIQLQGVSLRSALKLMLEEIDLTTVVRDEVLLITSKEQAETQLTTTTFLVRDLIGPQHVAGADADSLIELIVATVSPESWDEVGGAGSIEFFELVDGLVVSQTDDTLHKIEALIGKLRKVRNERDPWSVEKWQQQRAEFLATPQFQTYTIDQQPTGQLAVEAETVVKFLQRSLPKGIFERTELRINSGTITMFLTPTEAAEVDALLRKAKLPVHREGTEPFVGGFGNGFGGQGGGFF